MQAGEHPAGSRETGVFRDTGRRIGQWLGTIAILGGFAVLAVWGFWAIEAGDAGFDDLYHGAIRIIAAPLILWIVAAFSFGRPLVPAIGIIAITSLAGFTYLGTVSPAPRGTSSAIGDFETPIRGTRQSELEFENIRELRFPQDDPAYDETITLQDGRKGLRFELTEEVRLRIDVRQTREVERGADDFIDPEITLLETDRRGEQNIYITEDDDGGSGLNSRIEQSLVPGHYKLIIGDLDYNGEDKASEVTVVISKMTVDDLNQVGPLALDGVPYYPKKDLYNPKEMTFTGSDTDDKNAYLVKFDEGSLSGLQGSNADACFIVRVKPTGGGDTILGIFNTDNERLAVEDDTVGSGEFITYPLQAGRKEDLIVRVGAYQQDTNYEIYMAIRKDEGTNCLRPDDEGWRDPLSDKEESEREPTNGGPEENNSEDTAPDISPAERE